jgi:hypothetical protein
MATWINLNLALQMESFWAIRLMVDHTKRSGTYPRDVFESVDDKEIEESIFVDEKIQGFESDKDEHIAPTSTSSPGLVPTSTHEAEAPQAATSSSAGVQASGIEREINFENGVTSHIPKMHPPQ